MFRWMLTYEIPENEAIAILRDRIERPVAVILTGDNNRHKEEIIVKIACHIDCMVHGIARERELSELPPRFFARQKFIIIDPNPRMNLDDSFWNQTVRALRAARAKTIVTIHVGQQPATIPDSDITQSTQIPASAATDIDHQFIVWR